MDITVIIPVKDRRDHIGKTLDSILKSGISPKEVIIVDNESTDGTYQFCEQYIKNRPNTTLLRETFPGAAAARNKGLKSCKTEWVYFFDSDDIFDYNFMSTFYNANVEGYDMIAVPTKRVVDGKSFIRTYIPTEDPRVQILGDVLGTANMLFRTDFLKSIGAWNTACRAWEDWELGLRVMLHQPKILWFKEKAFHEIIASKDSVLSDNYSLNYKNFNRTLMAAINDLQSSILQPLSHYHAQHLSCLYPHLDLLMYPLYLRASILLGHMQREKSRGKSNNYKLAVKSLTLFRKDNFNPTANQKFIGNLLRFYTMLGGKDAWKIALRIALDKSSRKA